MARPLLALPAVAAGAAWLAAVAWAGLRLDPWGPFGQGFEFYGLAHPAAWVPWVLVLLGLAGLVAAIALRHFALPYAAVAPVAALAGGAKQLASTQLVDVLVFAVLALATIELLTVRERFRAVVESGERLSRAEQAPLASFMARYAAALALALGALAAALWVLVQVLAPLLASVFSVRLADSVELESAVGISIFVAIPLLVAVAVRVLVDGVRARHQAPAEAKTDIAELRPIARETRP